MGVFEMDISQGEAQYLNNNKMQSLLLAPIDFLILFHSRVLLHSFPWFFSFLCFADRLSPPRHFPVNMLRIVDSQCCARFGTAASWAPGE